MAAHTTMPRRTSGMALPARRWSGCLGPSVRRPRSRSTKPVRYSQSVARPAASRSGMSETSPPATGSRTARAGREESSRSRSSPAPFRRRCRARCPDDHRRAPGIPRLRVRAGARARRRIRGRRSRSRSRPARDHRGRHAKRFGARDEADLDHPLRVSAVPAATRCVRARSESQRASNRCRRLHPTRSGGRCAERPGEAEPAPTR